MRLLGAPSRLLALVGAVAASFAAATSPATAVAHPAARLGAQSSFASAISPNAASGIVADSLSGVSVAVSEDATQDVPVTITVTGEAEAASKLFVYVSAGGACASEPVSNGGVALSNVGGEEIDEGSFEKSYEYTVGAVGFYTVCAYVDEAEGSAPAAIGEEIFDAAPPTGSASIAVSASPTQDEPVTITVSGETEVARKLFVYVESTSHVCEREPAGDSGGVWLSTAGGEALAAGSFKVGYKYTPTSVALYTVCVYVDEAEAAVPDATAEANFEATPPTASLSIQFSANPIRDEPVTITVSGETEVARRLFAYISSSGNGCETTPEAEVQAGREALSREHGESLAAGSFKRSYSYTPEFIGAYTVCAFVDEGETAEPTTSATARFTVSLSQAEAEERVAAAEAEERRLKAVHEAEVSAREAAAQAAREAAAAATREAAAQAAAAAAQEAAARTAQEAAAKAATERAEAEVAAATAAKLKAARGKPVARLSVSAVSHDGPSLAHPGYTSLQVTTSPFAFVTVSLTRNGHRTVRREWGEQPSAVAAEISWSCQHPGGTYLYTVTAWTSVGRKLSKRGRFAPVSVTRCRALEKQEASTGAQRRAQAKAREAREYEEELERRQRGEDEERERQEATCRAEGGTPTILIGPEGTTWVCKASDGGTLPTA